MKENLGAFDAQYFGVSATETSVIDSLLCFKK